MVYDCFSHINRVRHGTLFFCLSNAVLISCFSFWYQSSLMFAIVVVPRNLCASPNTSLQTYLRAIIHEVMRSFEQMAWNMC